MGWNLNLPTVEERSESLGDIILETEELVVLAPCGLMWLIDKIWPSQRLCIESLWTVSVLAWPICGGSVFVSSWSVHLWGVLIRIKLCFGKSTNPGEKKIRKYFTFRYFPPWNPFTWSISSLLMSKMTRRHCSLGSKQQLLPTFHEWDARSWEWSSQTVALPCFLSMLVSWSFSSCPLAMISECSNFWAWERCSEDVRGGKNIVNSYWKSCLPSLWAWGRFKYGALPQDSPVGWLEITQAL